VPHPGPAADTGRIYGQQFFPKLISEPFMHGLLIAFGASIIMLLIAAGASMLRGERYVHEEPEAVPPADLGTAAGPAIAVEPAAS
jgi:hypothetical protein